MKRGENAVDGGKGTACFKTILGTRKPGRAGKHAQPALRAFARSSALIGGSLVVGAVMLPVAVDRRMRGVGVHLLRLVVRALRHHRRSYRGDRQPEREEHDQQFAQNQAHRFMLAHGRETFALDRMGWRKFPAHPTRSLRDEMPAACLVQPFAAGT